MAILQGAMIPPSRPENATGEYISETGFYQSITLNSEEPIIKTRSKYQDISVVESDYYGKILVLDGVVQLTERDANSYNEMMAHPAMFSHKAPKRVLVIGGGDGYVLSEVRPYWKKLSFADILYVFFVLTISQPETLLLNW